MEKNYDFRKKLLAVHKPNIYDKTAVSSFSGLIVDDTWEILYPKSEEVIYSYLARDLQEFFEVSHGICIVAYEYANVSDVLESLEKKVVLTNSGMSHNYAPEFKESLAYRVIVNDGIIVCGNSARGTAQGCYFVEDEMNLNLGPMLEPCDVSRRPLFSPRMVHSGYAMDVFPDEHLKAIAHAGMDAILVFVKDVDLTPHGYVDFNELVERAAAYGIDVYAYSYIKCWKHPNEPDARKCYADTYGRIFKECPGFRGIVLVGESVEFPSRDPRTTGQPHRAKKKDNSGGKPSPGWYPCSDFPDWLNLVKDVIRENTPNADIVFWTYNWGYVEEEARLNLIRNIPTDISLLVTYEMFEEFKKDDEVTVQCTDYTLSFEGPGKYFLSEAKEAKKRGIRLYTMCNTGGLTWDIGVIPFEPAPFQWKLRYDGLVQAHYDFGLCGLMESHHYGFWPSFVSELAKNAYWEPNCDFEEMVQKIARRDYGKENVKRVIEAWRCYSEGIKYYISTNEDQYGPFRIGPAYPLLFKENAVIPSRPGTHFGNNRICNPMYSYDITKLKKMDYEIKSLEKMRGCYRKGNILLEYVFRNTDGRYKKEAASLLYLGKFIENSAVTTIHVKQWYKLKRRLMPHIIEDEIWAGGRPQQKKETSRSYDLPSYEEALSIVDKMKEIANNEILNATNTIPLVEYDSRLGFEPSMDYMCDREHLLWKIETTNKAVLELNEYLESMQEQN